ncbi:MAG: 30S ribosomal protein S7 [Patescibacteria group bacterium]|nr:30S ribosomal protein S7 [Patescibacteria group bacterium]MDP6756115.1 30S ribosomal protein S7 [Patescibacteria group bacterium]|tara:strand:- start:15376 stop:15840 length:465 start_codon:yes stop_codon:yes gene_type:complete
MRGKQAPKRTIHPDPKFNSTTIAKFINYVMRRGKKSTAQKVVYGMLDAISEKTKQDPLTVFDHAIKNISPQLEVKSRRVGGANYQIPIEVRGERKYTLACRWLLAAAKARKGKPMHAKLADEIIAATKNEGAAMKKKEDTLRMAESNRAFAHFG